MTRDFRDSLVPIDGTLRDGMVALERGAIEIAFAVEPGDILVGTLTDGDVRRALLRGAALDAPLAGFCNRRFVSIGETDGRADAIDLMQARQIGQVPICDSDRRIVGVHLLRDVLGVTERPHWAVVMAGGFGTRLGSLTQTVPKPMLKVAGRPILEHIVLHLVSHGFRRIFLSVHYLAEQIVNHFGDGSRHGCRIDYLHEATPLGTGGALSLLPERPTESILVMNGDLVTQADVGALLAQHDRSGHLGTIAMRRYFHQVPFGCLDVDGDRLRRFEEKPTLSRLVNAGIYALRPELVARVPAGTPFGLPTLFEDCLQTGEPVGVHELLDDWIDVGQRDQLRQARGER